MYDDLTHYEQGFLRIHTSCFKKLAESELGTEPVKSVPSYLQLEFLHVCGHALFEFLSMMLANNGLYTGIESHIDRFFPKLFSIVAFILATEK